LTNHFISKQILGCVQSDDFSHSPAVCKQGGLHNYSVLRWLTLSVTKVCYALQMTFPTAPRASPPRCSASMSRPWRRTPPTSSEPSSEPFVSPTLAPRGTSRGLSSTRCVNVLFHSHCAQACKGGRDPILPYGSMHMGQCWSTCSVGLHVVLVYTYLYRSPNSPLLFLSDDHYSMCLKSNGFYISPFVKL
jgi:hypothetical protein